MIFKVSLDFTVGLTLSVSVGLAQGGDAAQTAVAKLAQGGEVACQPSLPVFCSNIHVSCSGPSSIKTFPFKLRATSSHGSIESAADSAGITQQYENARAQWDGEGAYVIVRPREANGYIKVLADGTYIFRHYSQYAATMSLGRCD